MYACVCVGFTNLDILDCENDLNNHFREACPTWVRKKNSTNPQSPPPPPALL